MSEEKEKKQEQRDRVHRAALLQAEIDDIPIALEEIDKEIGKMKRSTDKMETTTWNQIFSSLREDKADLKKDLIVKEQKLKDLQQEIKAYGGKPTLTHNELEDEKRLAVDWYIKGRRTHEGLPPRNRSNRDSLMAEIQRKLVGDDHQLIIAPYQSGKTSLALLFVAHLMLERVSLAAPDGNVFYLSLADYEHPANDTLRSSLGSYLRKETAAMNKLFPNVHPIRGWKAFEDLAKNKNNILVMDESQQLFEYEQFWRIFKTAIRSESCKALALGSYAFPSLRGKEYGEQIIPTRGMASPVGFIPNSYEILAFNDTEFDEVFSKFKVSSEEAGQPNKFGKDLQRLVKFWVTSSEAVKKQQQLQACLDSELRIYHPGLTFASLLVISEMCVENEGDVLAALDQRSLYLRLRDKKCRCLVSFSEIEETFLCRIKRNFSKQSQGHEGRLGDKSKEDVDSAIREFPKTFLDLVLKLLQQGFIVLSNNVVEISYKESLVNNALCFEDDSSASSVTLRLSCELMREHLAFELRTAFNFNGPAPPLMSFVTVADYITAVLFKFDPARLRLYQKSKANGHIYEDSIQTEFVLQSTLHTLHFLQGEFRFNKTSQNHQVGVIDFFVKDKSWGIEFMCFANSRICDDHPRRFEQIGRYMKSKQIAEFVLVDIMHGIAKKGSKPRETNPKLATYDNVPDEMLQNIFIVHLSADFTLMTIFKIIKGHDQKRAFKEIVKGRLSSLTRFQGFTKKNTADVTNKTMADVTSKAATRKSTRIQNSQSQKRKTTSQNESAKQQKQSND